MACDNKSDARVIATATASKCCSSNAVQSTSAAICVKQTPLLSTPLFYVLCAIAVAHNVYLIGDYLKHRGQITPNELAQSTDVTYPTVFTVAYIAMVTLGKRYFMSRGAVQDCHAAMVVYNGYQVAFNTWWLGLVTYEHVTNGCQLWSTVGDGGTTLKFSGLAWLVWAHYSNKFMEMLDTLFMVIRCKERQISFLHVYHHAIMSWVWLPVVKYHNYGDVYFGAAANGFIHVFMYAYYFMALLKIPCPWKVVLTQGQLLQFVLIMSHAVAVGVRGLVPPLLVALQITLMLQMLILFGNFYRKTYGAAARPMVPPVEGGPHAVPAAAICIDHVARRRGWRQGPGAAAARRPSDHRHSTVATGENHFRKMNNCQVAAAK